MRSEMRWLVVDDLMVCVASGGEPDRETLARFLQDLRSGAVRRCLSTPLSVSDAIDVERRACAEIVSSQGIQVALVVESNVAPLFSSVLRQMSASMAAFDWDNVEGAFQHLAVSGSLLPRAREGL